MQRLWLLILLGPALMCAHAADYPDKPVRFIVGFTPGGPSDIVAEVEQNRFQHIADASACDRATLQSLAQADE